MAWHLVVIAGDTEGLVIPLPDDKRLVIGRDPSAEINLPDLSLARRHVSVEVRDGRVRVENLYSRADVFAEEVSQTLPLVRLRVEGERFAVGQVWFRLEQRDLLTAQEWQESHDLSRLLGNVLMSQPSERKLRLLACAIVRRLRNPAGDPLSEQIFHISERYADQMAETRERYDVCDEVMKTADPARRLACATARDSALSAVFQTARLSARLRKDIPPADVETIQADLLRDIFVNPCLPIATMDPSWLAWNEGTIRRMAQTIYDERRFRDLPILADALEEAGCDNQDILHHCRQWGEHGRGCWVVDNLIGKS
jgi:Inner membrane component of T3SS, cytoplasmic domain